MQVKKQTLYIVCPIIVGIIILCTVLFNNVQEEKAKERDRQELVDKFKRECDKEYEKQLREYSYLVKSIKDWDYSFSMRFKYVMKLNELLGTWQYENTGNEYSTVNNCIDNLSLHEDEDKKLLKQKAYNITRNRFLGVDD